MRTNPTPNLGAGSLAGGDGDYSIVASAASRSGMAALLSALVVRQVDHLLILRRAGSSSRLKSTREAVSDTMR
jgi:hypothetical protein